MRIVLDTNVIVSAFLNPRGIPARILRLILQGDLDIVVNEPILAEYAEVLARPKFDLSRDEVQKILGFIRSRGVKATFLAESFRLPDASDEVFLEAALATGVDALVTGNKKHFPKSACKGQRVVTPREFLDQLEG